MAVIKLTHTVGKLLPHEFCPSPSCLAEEAIPLRGRHVCNTSLPLACCFL